ncbi:hypothetical protein JVU11DRAFT_2741 [Chiua virens]|nr:hypothetical protein JVU11DRAFT_2741 [Chiua virens]
MGNNNECSVSWSTRCRSTGQGPGSITPRSNQVENASLSVLPMMGGKNSGTQYVEVEEPEVSQRAHHADHEEHWGKGFEPRCPPDDGQKDQQEQRVEEVEEVLQQPRHADRHEEGWGKNFKPHCPPDYGQKDQQTLRIDSEYEQVTFQDSKLDTQVVVQQEQGEKGKRWYDIDDKRKIGGGILAGVATLGAGYMTYNRFRESTEKRAARAWSANAWVTDSQARTRQWRAGRHNAPIAWIWNEGRSIPRDAIRGGEEHGEAVYICRVYHQGGIMVGKASGVFKKGAVIGYKKDEIHASYDKYEILVGDHRAVRWITCSGQFNLGALHGARPIEGGREPDGSPIYIAQAPCRGAVYPGKACEVYGDGCFIPYDDTEKKVKEYAVLCYA